MISSGQARVDYAAKLMFSVQFELELLFGVLAALRAVYGDNVTKWRAGPEVNGFFLFTNAYALLCDIWINDSTKRRDKNGSFKIEKYIERLSNIFTNNQPIGQLDAMFRERHHDLLHSNQIHIQRFLYYKMYDKYRDLIDDYIRRPIHSGGGNLPSFSDLLRSDGTHSSQANAGDASDDDTGDVSFKSGVDVYIDKIMHSDRKIHEELKRHDTEVWRDLKSDNPMGGAIMKLFSDETFNMHRSKNLFLEPSIGQLITTGQIYRVENERIRGELFQLCERRGVFTDHVNIILPLFIEEGLGHWVLFVLNTTDGEMTLMDPTNYEWGDAIPLKIKLLKMFFDTTRGKLLGGGTLPNTQTKLRNIQVQHTFKHGPVEEKDSGVEEKNSGVCLIHWLFTLMTEGSVDYGGLDTSGKSINNLRLFYADLLYSRLKRRD